MVPVSVVSVISFSVEGELKSVSVDPGLAVIVLSVVRSDSDELFVDDPRNQRKFIE